MSILLVQIFGGIIGLSIAWLIDYYYTMYQDKNLEKLRKQHQLEIENYKKSLRKSS
jgi:hypothetical protein